MDIEKNEILVTTFEAADRLKIKLPRLREWLSRGYIEPAVPSSGRGTKAFLDAVNLYQVKLFSVLVGKGFSRDQAAHAVKSLRKGDIQNKWDSEVPLFLSLYEMSDGYQGESLFSSTELTIKTKTEQGEIIEYQVFNIGRIVREVNGAFLD